MRPVAGEFCALIAEIDPLFGYDLVMSEQRKDSFDGGLLTEKAKPKLKRPPLLVMMACTWKSL